MSYLYPLIGANRSTHDLLNDLPAIGREIEKAASHHFQEKATFLSYCVSCTSDNPDVYMKNIDFKYIADLLLDADEDSKLLILYLETPGGELETAHLIGSYFRERFDKVYVFISSACMSAGTILALCGDEIYMTETGSLGPIDPQITNSRGHHFSGYDFLVWLQDMYEKAKTPDGLSKIDIIHIQQTIPGEIEWIKNAISFGTEVVSNWLAKYKFKNWNFTEVNGKPVSQKFKKRRAKAVAEKLCNAKHWKSHGRYIRPSDLQGLLKIKDLKTEHFHLYQLIKEYSARVDILFVNPSNFKIFANSKSFLIQFDQENQQ